MLGESDNNLQSLKQESSLHNLTNCIHSLTTRPCLIQCMQASAAFSRQKRVVLVLFAELCQCRSPGGKGTATAVLLYCLEETSALYCLCLPCFLRSDIPWVSEWRSDCLECLLSWMNEQPVWSLYLYKKDLIHTADCTDMYKKKYI